VPKLGLTLRVDAPPAGPDGATDMLGPESERVRKRIYAELRLKPHSVAWVSLTLGKPRAERALDFLIEECRRARAVVGTAHLFETMGDAEAAQAEWSVLHTRTVDGSFSLWDDYPQCRAGTLPAVHALNHSFVSSAFVGLCAAQGLRGIEFLRCRSSGRKPGPPWFAALPQCFLGKGLDHPWFDRVRWVEHVAADRGRRNSSVDTGQSAFHQFWLRPAVIDRDPLLARLLALCPMPREPGSGLYGLHFQRVPRYLRGVQPDADFAYLPWGEDGLNREGKVMRFRQLAVRQRARRVLTAHGLFRDRDFLPVQSLAAAEPGVAVLDGRGEAPGPMFDAAELAGLRARERRLPA